MEKQRINFIIKEEAGAFNIYCAAIDDKGKITRETLCGCYPTREIAEVAIARTAKFIEPKPQPKKVIGIPRLRTPNEGQVQNLMLGLDPARMTEFFHEIIMMNAFIHMLTDSFDKLDTLFSKFIDASTKQHYKIASKHIEKLLAALYGSMFSNQSGADEYTQVVGDSLNWKAIIERTMMHTKVGDWRWTELKKAIERIYPTEAITNEDIEAYYKLRSQVVGNDIIDHVERPSESNEQNA